VKHNLIIPAAGLSTRFPNMRPKWALTHPDGDLMLISSLKGLAESFDNVYVTLLEQHIEEYDCKD
jgi:2-C-methyl-D-erythritol 4-phosphate cytidylyltransferase